MRNPSRRPPIKPVGCEAGQGLTRYQFKALCRTARHPFAARLSNMRLRRKHQEFDKLCAALRTEQLKVDTPKQEPTDG